MIILLTEFSPYHFENYLLKVFPFLEVHAGRGIFYTILGSFCLDPAMGALTTYAGVALMICGVLYVIAFFIMNRGLVVSYINLGQAK